MKHPVDSHVGKRIRQRRWVLGMTQQQLAREVGIKFQQIQKYETGTNRVSASRLWAIADVIEVPVSFFFDGLSSEEDAEAEASQEASSKSCQPITVSKSGQPIDVMTDREAMELVRSYYAIPEQQRRQFFELARALSNAA